MKSVTKKIMVSILATALCATASISTAFASDIVAGERQLSNEYIKILFSDDGTHYLMYTTGGDPNNDNDDNQRLLYASETSSMFINIDDYTKEVGSSGDIVVDAENKQLVTTYYNSGVELKKVLTVVPNTISGREDTVEFKLIATNTSEESHIVGARIMIDTMLGSNDYAPFRIPNIGAVTTRTQLTGDDIPVMYQAFDSLDNPTIIATGSFATGIDKPDIVQFNNWRISNSIVYIPDCDSENTIGDSAVNAIWNQKELAPGESAVYKMYYGLGEVATSSNSDLVLGATKVDSDFTVNEDGTGYNPVSIMGYIKNTGDTILNNVEMSIELPEGVSLVDESGNVNIGLVNINGEAQTTWTLNAEAVDKDTEIYVTINAKSDETGEVEPITYKYTLPAIVVEEPTEAPTEAPTEQPTEAPTEAPTEQPTEAPTEAPTKNPTAAPTTAATSATTATGATTATSAPTASATNATTAAETGKVATGDSTSVLGIITLLLTSAGTAVTLRRRAKNR